MGAAREARRFLSLSSAGLRREGPGPSQTLHPPELAETASGASVEDREELENISLFCPEVGQVFILKPSIEERNMKTKQKTQPCQKRGTQSPRAQK